jgi:hypothetical protein
MSYQGDGENKSGGENDDNLEGLLQNDDDTDSLVREIARMDRHIERVR